MWFLADLQLYKHVLLTPDVATGKIYCVHNNKVHINVLATQCVLNLCPYAVLECSSLTISNGNVVVTGFNLGDNAMYECNDGFTLVGGGTRMCIVDPPNARAVWSGEDPMCFSELTILFHAYTMYIIV